MSWWNQTNNYDKVAGQDYTNDYMKNKNAFFYIGKEGSSDELIVLKPFLSNLTYDLNVEIRDKDKNIHTANSSKAITGEQIKIKVELDVPAVSVSEARTNAIKIGTLMSWLKDEKRTLSSGVTIAKCLPLKAKWKDDLDTDGNLKEDARKKLEAAKNPKLKIWDACVATFGKKSQDWKDKGQHDPGNKGEKIVFIVSFANLIQSGNYTEEHEILATTKKNTYKNMQKYGLRAYVSDIKTTVDVDMGFFETTDLLIPKVHKLSFEMTIPNSTLEGGEHNIIGFGTNQANDSKDLYQSDSYHKNDLASWPFGVAKNKTKPKITNSYSYKFTNNRDAFIEFKKHSQLVKFMPYLQNFSIERKISDDAIVKFKHLTGEDRIVFDTMQPLFNLSFVVKAENLSHAKAIHLSMQKLMRMIAAPKNINTTALCRLLVKFKNLIGSGANLFETNDFVQCISNQLSIKPNLEFGVFEDNGMLYYKSFTLSMTLQVNDTTFKG